MLFHQVQQSIQIHSNLIDFFELNPQDFALYHLVTYILSSILQLY